MSSYVGLGYTERSSTAPDAAIDSSIDGVSTRPKWGESSVTRP